MEEATRLFHGVGHERRECHDRRPSHRGGHASLRHHLFRHGNQPMNHLEDCQTARLKFDHPRENWKIVGPAKEPGFFNLISVVLDKRKRL